MGARTAREGDGSDAEQWDEQISDVHCGGTDGGSVAAASGHPFTSDRQRSYQRPDAQATGIVTLML
jgi:hypothetical protein